MLFEMRAVLYGQGQLCTALDAMALSLCIEQLFNVMVFVKQVSKNAFIFCAVYGDAFCPSAAASFKLVWRNLARVAAVTAVGSYIIFLGKILVSFLTAGIAGVVMVQVSRGLCASPRWP